MAFRTVYNKKGNEGRVVLLNTSNSTISLANLAFDGSETVVGATILRVAGDGPWSVLRGANTIFPFQSNTFFDLDLEDSAMTLDAGATIVTQGEGGFLLLEVRKQVSQ